MKEGQVENTGEPEEVSGKSLAERAEKVDGRMRVTDTIAKAPELLESGASAVIVEGKGSTVDCAPLTSHINTAMPAKRDSARDDTTHSDTLIMGAQVSEGNDSVTEVAMVEQIRSQILQYPPEVQVVLEKIFAEALELRAAFSSKRLLSLKLSVQRGGEHGTEAQHWHQDGEVGSPLTRIIKTYEGPETEFSNDAQDAKLTPPPGSVVVFKDGRSSAVHRGPAIQKNQIRIRLQIELAD